MTRVLFIIVAFTTAFCAANCFSADMRILWPPDDPHLEFFGVYSSAEDLTPPAEHSKISLFLRKHFTVPGIQLRKPFGVVSDGRGKVLVSDVLTRTIDIFDFKNKQTATAYAMPSLERPLGIFIDKSDNFYIADGAANRVIIHKKGHSLPLIISKPGILERPAYIAVNDSLDRLYVSDGKACKVHVLTVDGDYLFSFGRRGKERGEFLAPQGLALDSKGRLFVADMLNSRIQVFDQDGKFLYMFGDRGPRYYDFENPKDLAFASDDTLYIIDSRKSLLLSYAPNGKFKYFFGNETRSDNKLDFSLPTSISIDDKDKIYIADQVNARFTVLQHMSREYLRSHPITEEEKSFLDKRLLQIKPFK